MVTGFIITVCLLTSLVLITCICSGQKLTSELQIIEKQIESSSYSGKPVRLMTDAMECVILKTDGVVSPLCHRQSLLIKPQFLQDARFGILSKSGADAKKMFTDKVVPISVNYPFFFKPIQDGMDRPKTELAYRVPASKLTRRKLESNEKLRELQGLDTTIDWKNTGDNSYDGEKLKLLSHDESGKWERPDNILNNWRVTKTTLRLGRRIVGKCMMGSTSNALDKGGENFKKYGVELRRIHGYFWITCIRYAKK